MYLWGNVRDINEGCTIEKMSLEHYPGMTEKSLTKIVKEAQERWHIQRCDSHPPGLRFRN